MKRAFVMPALALLASLSRPAAAAPIVIEESDCLKAAYPDASKYLLDYGRYSVSVGAAYRLELGGLGDLKLLEMIKSQSKDVSASGGARESLVWIVLRPLNFADANLYPKMLLRCASQDTAGLLTLDCGLQKDKLHFGVQEFQSRVTLSLAGGGCHAGEIRIGYKVSLESDPAAVARIKAEAVKPYPAALAGILSSLFDEKVFFRNYFRNLYAGWVRELTR